MDYLLCLILFGGCFIATYRLSELESGCLSVICIFVVYLLFLVGVLWVGRVFENPKQNWYREIQTSRGMIHEFRHTQRYCTSTVGIYTVVKKDSIQPNRLDQCINCGEAWYKHEYIKSPKDREIDAKAYEGLIVPVD